MTSASQCINPSFWKGRKVLLTGHTGFKGSWLALWLLELGAEVTGIALEPDGDINLFDQLCLADQLNHNVLDITDLETVSDLVLKASPEVVFHLAAQPLVRLSYEIPLNTWTTNVIGTLNLLEVLRRLTHPCSAIMVTTDKVYQNREWIYGYRETDPLGGHDPYSSSKAAAEIAIASWRSSFCGSKEHQTSYLRLASARAGNVIGGGDWSKDRIIPDMVRALSQNSELIVRNPGSTRPWQHVLEPLSGYLRLAEMLHYSKSFAKAFNFGPSTDSNRSVRDLMDEAYIHWPGTWIDKSDPLTVHESALLNLSIESAFHELQWSPRWNFSKTVERTMHWYKQFYAGKASALQCCRDDLDSYQDALLA